MIELRPYEQAGEMLRMEHLPDDAEERMQAYEDASNERERTDFFPWLWEGLFMKQNEGVI
jgi:hypothetical protein